MPAQSLATVTDVQRAKALYEYVAATNEEIDLEEGDLIIVEFKVWSGARATGGLSDNLLHCISSPRPSAFLLLQADNGWWIGTNSRTGMLGMFPGGFVEIVRG
jgi:hypothetical protein